MLAGVQSKLSAQYSASTFGAWNPLYVFAQMPSHLKEIAHASLLPGNEQGEIMLWCLPNCNGVNGYASVSYLWDKRLPQNLTRKFLPLPPPIPPATSTPLGFADLKGSGHAFLPNGDLRTVGGTNWSVECGDILHHYGHSYVFRFPLSGVREWVLESQSMLHGRWYPEVVSLPGGDQIVLGHSENPVVTPPSTDTYEYYTATGSTPGWNTTTLTNRLLGYTTGGAADCSVTSLLSVNEYPRVVQLRSKELLWADAYDTTPGVGAHYSGFLELDLTALSCAERRWKKSPTDPAGQRKGDCNVVHFVVLDPSNNYHDVVYRIGGALHNNPEFAQYEVDRIVDPDRTKVWDSNADDLTYNRVFSNSVILADGSIGVFDGLATDPTVLPAIQEIGRKTPEILKTKEVFSWGSSTEPLWEPMVGADATENRGEHCCALLLPDGSVWTGGGKGLSGSTGTYHTIQVYEPPYMHQGYRPVITSAPATWLLGSQATIEIDVDESLLTPPFGSMIDHSFRVALIRNGSATHHFDSSQRYVQLENVIQTEPEPGVQRITIRRPTDQWVAPIGYYMLVAVNAEGIPSAAKWIQLVP